MNSLTDKKLFIWSPRPFNNYNYENLTKDIIIYHYPLISINKREISPQEKNYLLSSDAILFISQHAVYFLLEQVPTIFLKGKKIITIGDKTKQYLSDNNISVDYTCPPPFSSESIILDNDFNNLEFNKLVIIAGNNGRNIIQKSLKKIGKSVIKIESYKRQKINYSPKIIEIFLEKNKINAILLTSCELTNIIFNYLQEQSIKNINEYLYFSLSDRISDYARSLGFSKIITSKKASYSELCNIIKYNYNQFKI